MKHAVLIALLLLAALVGWDIVLRIDNADQTPDFPTKTAEDLHDLRVFQEGFWEIVRGHDEENRRPEHAPAIAAAGFSTVQGIVESRGSANDALQEAWNTIEIIRSIHGDDGPETTFIFVSFLGSGPPLRSGLADVDVLVPILDAAWNTAQAPDRLALTTMGKKDHLYEYIAILIDRCAFLSEYSFNRGDLEKCRGYLDHMDAIMSLPWIEALHQNKENRIGTMPLDRLELDHDLVEARVLVLEQQYSEARIRLEAIDRSDRGTRGDKARAMLEELDSGE